MPCVQGGQAAVVLRDGGGLEGTSDPLLMFVGFGGDGKNN